MSVVQYREVNKSDIPSLAKIRAAESGTEEGWDWRITAYLNKEHHPQKAHLPRVLYVAFKDELIIGFVAGHLTERYECDGELQWINILPEFRRRGIAFQLVIMLAKWFAAQNASKISVDPGNETARSFYIKHGAEKLNGHWLFWKNINILLTD
jgi:ribosomal protein S18 acetylase RimI-like enzyme